MMQSADGFSPRLATRLAFLVAGFGIACWAPLVPFAKERLGVDEGTLGLLLLCLGIGSVVSMLVTAALAARFGCRPVILVSGLALALLLPPLAAAPTPGTLGLSLLLFGAALGSLDVAMNIHAVEVERAATRPLMSGFHALFSIGGFAGAAHMTFTLSLGVRPFIAAAAGAILMLVALAFAWPRLLRTRAKEGEPLLAVPRGVVLLLASLAAVTFLAEGAILDWSAVFVTQAGLVDVERAGVGYVLFAVAMTAGRLTGDALTTRIGDRSTLVWGGALAVAGFVVLLVAALPALALTGFILLGLGAANVVPVLFRRAGSQTVMPPGLAIAAVTTTGYAGILAGPAAIGFVAQALGLRAAFWMLAALMCLVPLAAGHVAPRAGEPNADRE